MQQTTHSIGRLRLTLGALALAGALLLGATEEASARRVFIDPGHGGTLPGAVYGGIRESEINLAIARHLETILQEKGYETLLSRTSDVNTTLSDIPTWRTEGLRWLYAKNGTFNRFDDLQARCDMANAWGADIFVSIHANAAVATSANGAETFWRNQSSTDRILSQRLAAFVQEEYVRETRLRDRGVKIGEFYVLRWSNMPAILFEAGFMSNQAELTRLIDPAFQRSAAYGMARGIERFFDSNPFTAVYPRLYGADRFATAAAIAGESSAPSAGTIVLASGTEWPDALAGTPLTRAMNAPFLFTRANLLPESTRASIAARAPSRIVVLGGADAVATGTVDAAVVATGRDPSLVVVERIAGACRFETAASIARQVRVPADGRVFVVSGLTFADALSIAPFAGASRMPILLVESGGIPEATRTFIEEHRAEITRFEIIGGEGAVGAEVARELSTYAPVIRISGADRFATNIRVVERFASTGRIAPIVASGNCFPDALSAGAFGAMSRRPLILIGERQVPGLTRSFLLNNTARLSDPLIVGGSGPVTYQAEWMIRKSLER